jgi:hypothetical protein
MNHSEKILFLFGIPLSIRIPPRLPNWVSCPKDQGTHHISFGWAHLQMSLIVIKEEARKPRELRKMKK